MNTKLKKKVHVKEKFVPQSKILNSKVRNKSGNTKLNSKNKSLKTDTLNNEKTHNSTNLKSEKTTIQLKLRLMSRKIYVSCHVVRNKLIYQ